MVLKQRTVMAVLHTLEDCLRFRVKKHNPPVFLHGRYIFLPHRNASATGHNCIALILHPDQQRGLKLPEILFSMRLKDFRNAHALLLRNHPVHLDHLHPVGLMKVFRDG